ncbi:hypothetical protein L1887_55503 [Cichorium endivia]|nr:hypothetical protein L1887_55503 [Cichorium endivia]
MSNDAAGWCNVVSAEERKYSGGYQSSKSMARSVLKSDESTETEDLEAKAMGPAQEYKAERPSDETKKEWEKRKKQGRDRKSGGAVERVDGYQKSEWIKLRERMATAEAVHPETIAWGPQLGCQGHSRRVVGAAEEGRASRTAAKSEEGAERGRWKGHGWDQLKRARSRAECRSYGGVEREAARKIASTGSRRLDA